VTGESWGLPFDLIVARTPSRLSASSMRGSNGVAVMPLANSQSRAGYSHSPFAPAHASAPVALSLPSPAARLPQYGEIEYAELPVAVWMTVITL